MRVWPAGMDATAIAHLNEDVAAPNPGRRPANRSAHRKVGGEAADDPSRR